MSFRPGMAKGPNLAAAAGSVTPTTFLGRYARTLILPRDFAPGIHTQYVQHISPPTYPGTKLSYLACEQRLNAPEGADFSELRVVVKPPDYYAGLSPLKIRHWTFFPSVTRTVFGITPTPEELEVTAYCWWVPAGWDFQNYTGVAATPSVASHAASYQVRLNALVNLTPDAAAGAWSDDKLLYLWMSHRSYNAGTLNPTYPNEYAHVATEIQWPLS